MGSTRCTQLGWDQSAERQEPVSHRLPGNRVGRDNETAVYVFGSIRHAFEAADMTACLRRDQRASKVTPWHQLAVKGEVRMAGTAIILQARSAYA